MNPHFFQFRKSNGETFADSDDFDYFWIGCADSAVIESQITGVSQSRFFVHDNLANIVSAADINCLSAMQTAIDIYKIRNVIICGHYGCESVTRTVQNTARDFSKNWLRSVGKIAVKHQEFLSQIVAEPQYSECLCELNVIEQAANACRALPICDAWKRGQAVTVYGLIYDPRDGLLHDLNFAVSSQTEILTAYEAAVENIKLRRMLNG